MRRKPGTLTSIEQSILAAAINLREEGVSEFHGFLISKKLRDDSGARLLIAFGTLYRALARLEKQGLLRSQWEDDLPADENRPRRRLYQLNGAGAAAFSELVPHTGRVFPSLELPS